MTKLEELKKYVAEVENSYVIEPPDNMALFVIFDWLSLYEYTEAMLKIKALIHVTDFSDKLKQSFSELLETSEFNEYVLTHYGYYSNENQVFLGIHPSLNIMRIESFKKYKVHKKSQNTVNENLNFDIQQDKWTQFFLEKIYYDLFHDDPDFKPELIEDIHYIRSIRTD